MPKNKNVKLLTISVMYKDPSELLKIFKKITYHARRGEQKRKDQWDEYGPKYSYYEFTQEYGPSFNFSEKHINGNVCHVYKSKL